MENNRRKFSRIAVNEETCNVTINGHSYHAKLVDQSIGGFRIEGLNLLMLPDNVPIVLEFDGETTEVVCRNVKRVDDNSFAVGLQRTDVKKKTEDEESTEITPQVFINSYVKLDETFKTLCWPLAVADSKLVVEVAGGKEFKVGMGKIQTFTKKERLSDLRKSNDSLKRLVELYTLTTGQIISVIPEAIVDFEFGPNNRLCVAK